MRQNYIIDQFREAIYMQKFSNFEDKCDSYLYSKAYEEKKTKGIYTAYAELDSLLYYNGMQNQKIQLGWKICKVYKYEKIL